MAYETPTLTFMGSANGLVRGDLTGPFGVMSDNADVPDEGLIKGNSRFRFIV